MRIKWLVIKKWVCKNDVRYMHQVYISLICSLKICDCTNRPLLQKLVFGKSKRVSRFHILGFRTIIEGISNKLLFVTLLLSRSLWGGVTASCNVGGGGGASKGSLSREGCASEASKLWPCFCLREETFSRCPDSFYFPYRSTFFLKSEITDAD